MASNPIGDEQTALRDRLALDRTRLANERTLLAYARTAIMLAATGATLLELYSARPTISLTGWALLIAGVCLAAVGALRFKKLAGELA